MTKRACLAGAATLLFSGHIFAEGRGFADDVIAPAIQSVVELRGFCVASTARRDRFAISHLGDSDRTPTLADDLLRVASATRQAGQDNPASSYKDLWERLRAGFGLPVRSDRLVARHEAWYLKHPQHLQRTIERGRRYLYFVAEEVEKRGMPTEIALLPIIESAYNPEAYSRMRAAGMWQFIPVTGRRYGLEQNAWYDGRRDVLAATHAALDYLQFLYDTFGDWELALGAYNWGEGAMQRAIAYNHALHRPTSYSRLRMPNETRNYLPRLIALRNVILNAGSLGVKLESIPNRPYFTVVKSPGNIEVVKAAQLANVPVEEFRSLNPGYSRPVILRGFEHEIVLPIDSVEDFHTNLAGHADPLLTWQQYVVKRGESLRKIAVEFKISVERLREINGIRAHKRVQSGSVLLVPSMLERTDDARDDYDDSNLREISRNGAMRSFGS
jgi:peptidoglycan lytic transglycosylase D